jgi:hypothetical protein
MVTETTADGSKNLIIVLPMSGNDFFDGDSGENGLGILVMGSCGDEFYSF